MQPETLAIDTLRPSRRTVVRGAAWAVPVIATAAAAPVFAASPCAPLALSWDSYANGTTFTSAVVGGVTVTLTVSGTTSAANNRTISSTATGGTANNLRFYDVNNVNGSSQTATFTFSSMVQNLSFSLLDIDSATSAWFDRVSVGTSGFTAVKGSTVIGTDTVPDPFRPPTTNTSVAGTSTTGNVDLSWTAGLTSVSFTYSQGIAATGSPFIGISDLSFRPLLC